MNDIEEKVNKNELAGLVIGSIIFSVLIISGVLGTISSVSHVYTLYMNEKYDLTIIWFFFGLFMLFLFIYFSKELYHLMKKFRLIKTIK
ncbi:hypothetical protein [Heyndrickxia vini]|uniref:Uncharacterized protein n=1 Tax=Heyndrickxia vini TaxID=1476025 RepID=A0ABX7E6L3_9BACI|nr:hypothetical protein [Heyndrickxia vini]QQZ11211.1 hypothetical protein I5776_10125 [Heyndrickxia vini]